MSTSYQDLNLTSFPEGIDDFPEWLDITAADGPLVKKYMQAVERGDSIEASNILAQIPQGTQKVLRATDLNKLTQAMLALERFYNDNVKDYIAKKQVDWGELFNQFRYRKTWYAYSDYFKNNMVSYASKDGVHVYIAIKDVPRGIEPTNTDYWLEFTVQGEQGLSGVGLSYREQWTASASYQVNDAVTYSGILWQALKPSTNVRPKSGSDSWKIVMSLASTTYPIQDTEPVGQPVNSLWFDTRD